MARKTNKTAHVLNLISKAKEEHQADANDEDLEINSIDSSPSGDLSFMNSQVSNDSGLSEDIKENLSKLLDPELEHRHSSITPQIDTETAAMHESNNSYSEFSDKPEDAIDANNGVISTVKNEIKPNEVNSTHIESDILQPHLPYMPQPKAVVEEIKSEPVIEEPDYKYLNVLEELVNLRVDEFIKMFEVCDCPRCRADIMALSLNGLPAKYIVVEKSHVSPLLNFFSNQYKSSITAQLSKACTVVKNTPHHKR